MSILNFNSIHESGVCVYIKSLIQVLLVFYLAILLIFDILIRRFVWNLIDTQIEHSTDYIADVAEWIVDTLEKVDNEPKNPLTF